MPAADPARKNGPRSTEWPTLLLAALIYGGWMTITLFHASIPFWVLVPVAAWLIAWHGSLQHETIHGHPTARPWLNAVIGGLPLALWLPYGSYARDHNAHHATDKVTDPIADPESRYLQRPEGRMGALRIAWATVQSSLLGRLILGPIDLIVGLAVTEVHRLRRTPLLVLQDWLPHMAGVALIGSWLVVCDLSLGEYLVAFVYPGMALSLLRSFAEHRAAEEPGHRVAIVERGGPLALLFLNNNLHAAHHRAPGVAWFRLPAFYRQHRMALLESNGGLIYRNYGEVVRRYAVRRHDSLIHPDWR